MTKRTRKESLPFKPRARLLLLLGDQLIRDPGIAVFELVKNAYDADSPSARVIMENVGDQQKGRIVVEDSGTGMNYETVVGVWLEPGTDYRTEQKSDRKRTKKFGRLPLGEKGVGRFAAHKLGRRISLVTRQTGKPEVVVQIDWGRFEEHKYLDDVPVTVEEREPEVFRGRKSGTRIEVVRLRSVWNKGMVRELYRAVNSICSPFGKKGDFKTEFVVVDHPEWLDGVLSVQDVLEFSLFRAHCAIRSNRLFYRYEFVPYPAMKARIKGRRTTKILPVLSNEDQRKILKALIGTIRIDLYIFDLDSKVLELGVSDRKGLKEYLKESGGIRVYRDGVRVYDYGEPGNDWLNLGGERVNIPTRRISNNIVVGAVSLGLDKSMGLIEKTNREGFVDDATYRVFHTTVISAITHVVAERNKDKNRIRDAYSSKRLKEPVLQDLTELRDLIEKKKLTKELGAYIDRIESDFAVIKDRFLTSASAGLSLTAVIHEVEKGVEELQLAVRASRATPRIKKLAEHLAELVEGFAALARKSGRTKEKASSLISHALFNSELRLRVHNISVTDRSKAQNFAVQCSRRLIISTIMNIVDNSIYWLDNKWGEKSNKKKLFIGSMRYDGSPAIVIADNGPGFQDPPEYLIEPFISRKPDGMGLGLHIADQVMKTHGGRLLFPDSAELELPSGFGGATVALVFSKEDT
jgi:signal transduction histidine kinase